MSWMPPKSRGATNDDVNVPLASVVAEPRTTLSFVAERPRKSTLWGRASTIHDAFDVPQVSVTCLPAGRPVPVTVNFVPATATSGFVVSACMLAAGVAAGAATPGSAATPGIEGITRVVGVAEARPGRSIAAPARLATVTAIFMWRFMAALAFRE